MSTINHIKMAALEAIGRQVRATLPKGWTFTLIFSDGRPLPMTHVWIENHCEPARARELLEEAIRTLDEPDKVTTFSDH